MTKTPKNGSSSSTPTPQGGGPGSVPAPPSVGSTKSEPIEAVNSLDNLGDARSGTPHSLPENNLKDSNNPELCDTMNGGGSSSSNNDNNLLCDNGLENNTNNTNQNNPGDNDNECGPGSAGAQVKSDPDMKPNCSTPGVGLPPEAADLFDGFDSKDGVKDEIDDSDNLAGLPDFKDEDLKTFDDACNDFSNGMTTLI